MDLPERISFHLAKGDNFCGQKFASIVFEQCPPNEKANKYSQLSLSRSPRDSVKYFEISIPRHIRFVEVRKKIGTTIFTNEYNVYNLTPEVRDTLKILWKRGEIALQEQVLLFSTIFCYL